VLLDDVVADRDRLIRALRRLSYGQRAVIVLRYWHQLSEQETAYGGPAKVRPKAAMEMVARL
jgi:Sigma-70, region 4